MPDAKNNECPSCAPKRAILPAVQQGTPTDTIPAEAMAILRANAAKPEVKARFGAAIAAQARAEGAVPAHRTVPVPHEPAVPTPRPMPAPSPARPTVRPAAEGHRASYLSLSRPVAIEVVGRPTYMRDMTQPLGGIADAATLATLRSWAVFGGEASHFTVIRPQNTVTDLANELQRTCRARHLECVGDAQYEHERGEISDEDVERRIRWCDEAYAICMHRVEGLRHLAERIERSSRDRKRAQEILNDSNNCLTRAMQLADPTQQARAIEACREKSLRDLLQLEYFYDLPETAGFAEIIDRLSPKQERECPCCVGSKESISLHTSGDMVGASSHQDYTSARQRMPTEFEGYKFNGFKVVEHKDIKGFFFWGFGIEISVPYTPDDCPCTCTFTQFVKCWLPGQQGKCAGRIEDDVTRWPVARYNEEYRKNWWPKCKAGRLYFGDFISDNVPGDYYFRTMFFSSATNCDRKWCAIDWMISVERKFGKDGRTTGFELAGFSELGRSEG